MKRYLSQFRDGPSTVVSDTPRSPFFLDRYAAAGQLAEGNECNGDFTMAIRARIGGVNRTGLQFALLQRLKKSSARLHNEDSRESPMRSKPRDLLARSWQSQASLSLFLFVLVFVAFVLPSVGVEKGNVSDDIGFSVVVVFGSAIAWGNRRLFVLTSLTSIVAVVLRWTAWWKPTNTIILWSVSATLAATLAITAVLLWQVLGPGPVTMMRVQGAIAAYLCIGCSWANAYHIAAILNPGAFSSTGSDVSLTRVWLNYSFGMLSTVGFTGVAPVTPLAHTLGSAEAMMGQLYLAVLVARLVAMQLSSEAKVGR
jgi:hypothetical protein